jgi:hypothetical protein
MTDLENLTLEHLRAIRGDIVELRKDSTERIETRLNLRDE